AWGGGVGLGHRDAGRQARRGVRERSRPRFLAHRPRCLDRVPPFGAVTGTRGRSAGARTTVQITFGGRRGCALGTRTRRCPAAPSSESFSGRGPAATECRPDFLEPHKHETVGPTWMRRRGRPCAYV